MSTRTDERIQHRFRLMNRNHITVVLVNGEKVLLPYNKTSYLSEAFDNVCRMTGVIDKDIFGLAQEVDGFYHFLNLSTKVSKINFKSFRKKRFTPKKPVHLSDSIISSQFDPTHSGVDQSPTLYFRVKFFVRAHTLRDRQTKHQYYEQLRQNFLRYPFTITDEQALTLASLILQADHGPYHPGRHKDAYFSLNRCLPSWCLSRFDQTYLRRHLPALHATHGRMTQSEAEFRFVRQVDAQPTHYNMHLISAVDRTTNPSGEPIWLGVSPIGLELYAERSDRLLVHMSTLVWQQIKKITYKKRLVMVQVGSQSRELRLDTQSSAIAEHLFWLCREMHLYQITAQMRAPRSVDMLDAQLAMRNGYRESYVYSDQADLQQHGSLGRGSHATSRPSSVLQLMSSDTSMMVNTLPRVNARKAEGSHHHAVPVTTSGHRDATSSQPSSRKGEKRIRKNPPAPPNVTNLSLRASTPNLATEPYLETDIDAFHGPQAGYNVPDSPHTSSGPSTSIDHRNGPPSSSSFLKQRALSCDGSTTFLHPEVRKLQENRALSSSLPLLTQLCRDPDLVQLLGVQDDSTLPSNSNGFDYHSNMSPYNNNTYGLHGNKMSNGFAGKNAPTAGMKSWRSEVLHLDRLNSDYEDDYLEDRHSMLARESGGESNHESSGYSCHFRDNDYINLKPSSQNLNSVTLQSSLA